MRSGELAYEFSVRGKARCGDRALISREGRGGYGVMGDQ